MKPEEPFHFMCFELSCPICREWLLQIYEKDRDMRLPDKPYGPEDLGWIVEAWQASNARRDELITKYQELLYAVGKKWPGETRHQTAFRYIRQAEEPGPDDQKAAEHSGPCTAHDAFSTKTLEDGDQYLP